MEAWRTSCPRLPVWEEADRRGFVVPPPGRAGARWFAVGARRIAARPCPPAPTHLPGRLPEVAAARPAVLDFDAPRGGASDTNGRETMEDLQGKVAVITGGASGIGRAVAERAAAEGMRFVLADIEEGPLREAERRWPAGGRGARRDHRRVRRRVGARCPARPGARPLRCRPSDPQQRRFGLGGPIWDVSEEDWRWILGVNLWGVIHGISASCHC